MRRARCSPCRIWDAWSIEDEATLGANATVDRGHAGKDTRIGKGARIDNLCHIGHNVDVGEYAIMAAFAGASLAAPGSGPARSLAAGSASLIT
jgi:UDP-3-O-[3-hydroxymyristoyl] glucosamine N-acyltransferase